jgi:outer membrane protein assembly factor BamB
MLRFDRLGLAATLVGALVLAVPSSAQEGGGSDWPQWRGPARDGISPAEALLSEWPESGPPLVWRTQGLGSGHASLSIADGRLFTLGDRDGSEYVIAIDASDGSELWRVRLGEANDDGRGRGGSRSTPTIDGNRVYALGTAGSLVSLDVATGAEAWRRSLPGDFGGRMMSRWKFSESPLVDAGRVVFTPGVPDTFMVAVDAQSGRELWRTRVPELGPQGRDGAGYSSIVVSEGGGVRQYVQLAGRGVVGVRASDGAYLWSYNRVANDVANVATPIVRGDLVFASTGYRTGSALLRLSPAPGGGVGAEEVYFLDAPTLQNHHGGLILVGDHVYGGHGHNNGFPICVELESGAVVWGGQIRNQGSGSAAVTFADGHLYFRYQNGAVLLIEATPEGYREKGSFEIPDAEPPGWAHPVIAEGRLYLRDQDRLFCYDIAASEG